MSPFTIIVANANEVLRPIHARMPVILDPADYALWLGEGLGAGVGLRSLLKPFPAEAMVAYPVSRRVNNPQNDDAQCVEPLRASVGHTQPATTARYAHLFDDPLRQATERVGAVVTAAENGKSGEVVPLRKDGGAA